jgi:hypothetical protein
MLVSHLTRHVLRRYIAFITQSEPSKPVTVMELLPREPILLHPQNNTLEQAWVEYSRPHQPAILSIYRLTATDGLKESMQYT